MDAKKYTILLRELTCASLPSSHGRLWLNTRHELAHARRPLNSVVLRVRISGASALFVKKKNENRKNKTLIKTCNQHLLKADRRLILR